MALSTTAALKVEECSSNHQTLLCIPYTAKLSRGKTFAVFTVFQPIAKVFSLNHLPCTVHNGMDLMHRENFPVNSVFCAQPRKFPPSKVLPYTVSKKLTLQNEFVNSMQLSAQVAEII